MDRPFDTRRQEAGRKAGETKRINYYKRSLQERVKNSHYARNGLAGWLLEQMNNGGTSK